MKASDGCDRATDRSAGSAYADGPVHYVLFDTRVGSPERITLSSRRADADVESLERKPSTVGS
jgi:hypothetical protein